MIKKITLITLLLVVLVVTVSACSLEKEEVDTSYGDDFYDDTFTAIGFTFANEADFDTTIVASIEGVQVYEKELISAATAGGYFGQEFEFKNLVVPDDEFSLEVTETTSNTKTTINIDPANGMFVSVTFWGDKFVIEQTHQKQVRFD